jgi:Cu+-exporting ATPase
MNMTHERPTHEGAGQGQTIETQLDIKGMTCASCVRTVEKALSNILGVESANVNFATHQASITHTYDVTADQLVRAVDRVGYSATDFEDDMHAHHSPSEHAEHLKMKSEAELTKMRQNLWLSAILTVPLFIVSMVWHPRPEWANWSLFVLGTPIIFWCGRQFFVIAAKALRHAATTMDTLVAMGAVRLSRTRTRSKPAHLF